MTVKIGSKDVTGHTSFTRTACEGDSNTVSNGQYVVHVFKPSITWKDTKQNYGYELTAENLTKDNMVDGVTWSHSNSQVAQPKVEVPTLTYEFKDPNDGDLPDTLTQETNVKVTVKVGGTDITGDTTFFWQKDTGCPATCVDPNKTANENPTFQFRIHLNSFDLTVKKEADETYDPDDTFLFTLTRDDGGYTATFTLKANESVTFKNLEAGHTYTVTEDTGWSWRYDCTSANSQTANNETTLTFINKLTREKWLSDDARAVNDFAHDAGTTGNARMSAALVPEKPKLPGDQDADNEERS